MCLLVLELQTLQRQVGLLVCQTEPCPSACRRLLYDTLHCGYSVVSCGSTCCVLLPDLLARWACQNPLPGATGGFVPGVAQSRSPPGCPWHSGDGGMVAARGDVAPVAGWPIPTAGLGASGTACGITGGLGATALYEKWRRPPLTPVQAPYQEAPGAPLERSPGDR